MDDTTLLAETIERLVLDDALHPAGRGLDSALWDALESGGFTRIGVPEAAGGGGGSIGQAHALLDRLGWSGRSVPIAEQMVAGWLCQAAGIVLPEGVVTFAPGYPEDEVSLEVGSTAGRVDGLATRVPWAAMSRYLVVTAPHPDGLAVAVVPARAAHVVKGCNLAGESRDRVEFHGIVIETAAVGVADGLPLDQPLRWGAMTGSVQLAATLRRIVELTRDHVLTRVQFGRPIATFQHVRHQVAEMAEEVAVATVAAEAAMVNTHGRPSLLEVASTKVRVAKAASRVTASAHQLHGAIGFTDEHSLHRYTTRAWSWRDELGTEGWWEERLGAAVIGGGADAIWSSIAGG